MKHHNYRTERAQAHINSHKRVVPDGLRAAAISTALVLAGLFGLPALRLMWRSPQVPFNSKVWRESVLEDSVRLTMIEDLLKRYHLVGMSRDQIEDLLGYPAPPSRYSKSEYAYWLGTEPRPMSFDLMDYHSLHIRFDKDKVLEAEDRVDGSD